MKLSRRSFLGGALAITGATIAATAPARAIPRIVGDGVHDDAPGLQALLDGRPCNIEGDSVRVLAGGSVVMLGVFSIGATLSLPASIRLMSDGAILKCNENFPRDAFVFDARGASNAELRGFFIDGSHRARAPVAHNAPIFARPDR